MANPPENNQSAPLHPAIKEFIHHLQQQYGKESNTAKAYQNDLTDFFNFLLFRNYQKLDVQGRKVTRTNGYELKTVALKDIRSDYVRSWIASLKNEEGYSSRSINRKISCLKSFFKFYLKRGEISKIPMDRVVSQKLGERLPVYLEEESMQELLGNLTTIGDNLHLGTSSENARGVTEIKLERALEWRRKTEELVIIILYLTGIRRSELMNLAVNRVDGARNTIKVLGKGNKERQIPVSGQLVQLLLEYEAQKKNFLSPEALAVASMTGPGKDGPLLLVREDGKALTPSFVYTTVKKYLGEVTSQAKRSPHVLRHTFATHLTYHGASLDAVKELLGHSSLAATQVYTHNSIESLKEIHKQAHPKA